MGEHVEQTYLPADPDRRQGVALTLSGGGFRAVMFEVGALRRLNELGLLSRVDTITSVSAGSMVLAQLALAVRDWPAPGSPIRDFETRIAAPLERLVGRNLRTAPMVAQWLRPWRWFDGSARIGHLERLLQRYLSAQRLTELAGSKPRYVMVATDNAFASAWESSGDRMGSPLAGYTPSLEWPVARAVAASCSFPPAFEPMPVRIDADELRGGTEPDGPDRQRLVEALDLSDGGAVDELGLERLWRDKAVLIAIDAGSTYPPTSDHGIARSLQILRKQITRMQKRWLIGSLASGQLEGAYLGLASPVEHYGNEVAGYSPEFVDEWLAQVRTDFDALSRAEIEALQNHGYQVADAAAEAHLHQIFPLRAELARVPYPGRLDEEQLRGDLDGSSERTFLGRGSWLRYVFA